MVLYQEGNWGRRSAQVCWNRIGIQTAATPGGVNTGNGGGGYTPPKETWIALFENANEGGVEEDLFADGTNIYTAFPYPTYFSGFWKDTVSSFVLSPASINIENGVSFFLFSETNYQGNFLEVYTEGAGEQYYNYVGGVLNDQASSALLVQHPVPPGMTNRRAYSFAQLAATANFNATLNNLLSGVTGTNISLNGNPGFQFTLGIPNAPSTGPLGNNLETVNNLPSNYTDLVRLEIPITVEEDIFIEIHCSIYLFLSLSVIPVNNSLPKLQLTIVGTDVGNFVAYGVLLAYLWVAIESSFKSKILDKVNPVIAALGPQYFPCPVYGLNNLYTMPSSNFNTQAPLIDVVDETLTTINGVANPTSGQQVVISAPNLATIGDTITSDVVIIFY